MSSDGKTASAAPTAAAGAAASAAKDWSADFAKAMGTEFVNNKGDKVSVAELKKNTAIALYFSAHWCPPCRGFTPELVKTYNLLKAANKKFEIIFVSSDRDPKAFNDYFGSMPWLALPFSDRTRKSDLSVRYGVEGIPTLVIIDGASGAVIQKNGRGVVSGDPKGEQFPWHPKPADALNMQTAEDINEVACLLAFVGASEEWSCASCSLRNTNPTNCEACGQTRKKDAASEAATVKSGVDEATAAKIRAAMTTVGTEVAASAVKQSEIRFLWVEGDRLGRSIGSFLARPTTDTVLAILDIPNRCKYFSESKANDINADVIRKFYEAYRAGTLKKVVLPPPSNDEE
jgi:thiol-disulfide isomerase/thioredoxin